MDTPTPYFQFSGFAFDKTPDLIFVALLFVGVAIAVSAIIFHFSLPSKVSTTAFVLAAVAVVIGGYGNGVASINGDHARTAEVQAWVNDNFDPEFTDEEAAELWSNALGAGSGQPGDFVQIEQGDRLVNVELVMHTREANEYVLVDIETHENVKPLR